MKFRFGFPEIGMYIVLMTLVLFWEYSKNVLQIFWLRISFWILFVCFVVLFLGIKNSTSKGDSD